MKLGLDCGFGDVKYVLDGRTFKEISAIAKIPSDTLIEDENYIEYLGSKYYVFNEATKLPSSTQYRIGNYENLKFSTPLFIKAIERIHKCKVDEVCLGLSIAMVNKSQDYKEYISEQAGIDLDKIYLIPQGLGSKIAYQHFNLDKNNKSQVNDDRSLNYLGIDIGFNTIDIFQVINNKISTNVVTGLEDKGIINIAESVYEHIQCEYNLSTDLTFCKEVIYTKGMTIRGVRYDLSEFINECLFTYFKDLFVFIENEFSSSIDKMDNMMLVGGGAALYKVLYDSNKEFQEFINNKYGFKFLLIPESPEYYNVLGYYKYLTSKSA